jgi:hypothetical protein
MAEISPLRHRMIEDMTVCNFSPAMQRSYIHAVSRFSCHFGRLPDGLGLEDVPAFQVQLVSTESSGPSHNQNVCALHFFYGVSVRQDTISERIPYAREPRTLPVVLSADEVVPLLKAVSSLKSCAALTIVYVAGMSISEVIGIKVEDIDSQRIVKSWCPASICYLEKGLRRFQGGAGSTSRLTNSVGSSAHCSCSIGWRVRNFAGAVHAGLNKGESRHALAQAAFFLHKQGRIVDRIFEN